MASRSKKRARSTPPQPSAALARLEMLAGSVLDAYGATNSFDKDGEAELAPARPCCACGLDSSRTTQGPPLASHAAVWAFGLDRGAATPTPR